MVERAEHWDKVWSVKEPADVSWYQQEPAASRRLILQFGPSPLTSVVDVGGGASSLAELLTESGVERVEVVDIAESALAHAAARLGPSAAVTFTVGDVTRHRFVTAFDVWHDRAVFHFLTEADDRAGYVEALQSAIDIGGIAILATFAADGPEMCSGLPVRRYSAESLSAEFEGFDLIHQETEDHAKPDGETQKFQYVVLQRTR